MVLEHASRFGKVRVATTAAGRASLLRVAEMIRQRTEQQRAWIKPGERSSAMLSHSLRRTRPLSLFRQLCAIEASLSWPSTPSWQTGISPSP